ncbi:electron transfer flavoprotein alpha/beta-subunit [Agrobacterium tumefaciens]|nr:electron transfer flavoprotein alpha/beta-subunit [Agrobacterium tumefaciens]
MLAALMGAAQATFASKIELSADKATVTREVDGGLQTIEVKLPAVVTSDLRLNEPRYASLPNIMKAKKKPLDKKTLADFGVSTTPKLKVLKTEEPSSRKAASRSHPSPSSSKSSSPLASSKGRERNKSSWQFFFWLITTKPAFPTRLRGH